MKTTLYFVRHAESPFSMDDERERGLSAKGAADAVRAAELLRHEGIAFVYSSPFRRAVDSVRPLADALGLPITLLESLHERPIASLRYSIGEDVLHDAIRQSFEDLDYCLEEGETTRTARDRAVPTILRLLDERQGGKIAIGTHGNIMTIILHAFDSRFGYDFWTSTSKPDLYRATFEGRSLVQVDRLWTSEEQERYPIGRFQAHPDPDMRQITGWLAELVQTPPLLKQTLAPLKDEQLDTPYRAGGWTVRQVVHHMADSDMNAYFRFKRALTEDCPRIPSFAHEQWAGLNDYREPVAVSLGLIESVYSRFLALLTSLKQQDFQRTMNSETYGIMRLDTALQRLLWHDRHHLSQIEALIKRRGW